MPFQQQHKHEIKVNNFVSELIKFLWQKVIKFRHIALHGLYDCGGHKLYQPYSSTDNWKPPIHVSDWLIFCCGNLILH